LEPISNVAVVGRDKRLRSAREPSDKDPGVDFISNVADASDEPALTRGGERARALAG
jgi:hypothetical protein